MVKFLKMLWMFFLNYQSASQELLVQEQLDGLYLEEAGGLIEAAMENFSNLSDMPQKNMACLQKHRTAQKI